MILNNAKNVRKGTRQVLKICKGSKVVWNKSTQVIIKPNEGEGTYLKPYKYLSGMTIENGKWYYLDDIDLPQEAIKDGIPSSFNDIEYFDIFW